MHNPFLTIGIASYNYSPYLDKALDQIKKQSFKDIEILYCDDGSTDDSVEKIQKFIAQENEISIRLVEGEHGGVLVNKNRIIDNARGRYIMICDADDYMLPDCLERMCQAARENNADCVIGGFCEVTDEGKILKKHIPDTSSSKWLYTWHHGQMYQLDIIRKYHIRFEQIPDDVFYLQNVHKHSQQVVFVQECVYAWCRHGKSTSNNFLQNQEWHPVCLWDKIAGFVSRLRDESNGVDAINLDYYLYKWYYFNITDLWKEEPEQIRKCIRVMQNRMLAVNPEYLSCHAVPVIMKSADTAFAKCAVMICWGLEKMHLLYMIVLIRRLQQKLRE